MLNWAPPSDEEGDNIFTEYVLFLVLLTLKIYQAIIKKIDASYIYMRNYADLRRTDHC